MTVGSRFGFVAFDSCMDSQNEILDFRIHDETLPFTDRAVDFERRISYFLQTVFELVGPSGHSFSFKLLENSGGSKPLDRSLDHASFVLASDTRGPSIPFQPLVSLWGDRSNEFSIMLSAGDVVFLKVRRWILIENQRLQFIDRDALVLVSLESLLPS